MSKYGYIYITINSLDGKSYVGQSRGKFKPKYLGSGKIIISAIKKHGRDNFSVEAVEWCESMEELNQAEKDYIAMMKFMGASLYNLHEGGIGARDKTLDGIERIRLFATGRKPSQETRIKMSLSKKGKPGRAISDNEKAKISAANTGKKRSEEAKSKMRAAKVGKPGHPLSEEHKAKLLKSVTGKVLTEEHKAKLSAAKKGKPSGRIFSKESREKMRLSHLGMPVSAETRAKLSAARKGRPWSEKMRASINALKTIKGNNYVTI